VQAAWENDLSDNLDMRDKKKTERFICEGFDADELLFLGEGAQQQS
jgi:hypothetical protein